MLKLDTIRKKKKKKNVRFLKRMRAADSVNIATMTQCTYTAHTHSVWTGLLCFDQMSFHCLPARGSALSRADENESPPLSIPFSIG